ncbi:Ankyrin repeat-containing domain-containing protein [Candidatus Desulfosporosinus infrequens]|uniref:Ankyrin repeat-containing domain-containing protein n=1 Tax=Candidatus Desulfosporosinus infrequens TaxID=2043169 RepID=A0A2U3LRE9_9FIRM|nr:Ankyrin repeat-containing domain-containing protein [Candidatus Desulfosporosinus infrequens]
MNDQEGLDQAAIDALLADASNSLPGLTSTVAEGTDPEAPEIPVQIVPTLPEKQELPTALPPKTNYTFSLKALKQQITKKQALVVLIIFLLVIASSGFIGYKKGPRHLQNQPPLEIIIQQGITFEEKNFVLYASRGDEDLVNAFLDSGMSADVLRSTDGWTPLMAASFYKKAAVVKLLLARHAAVNLQDKYGKTALMDATAMGAADIVNMLLESGANPNLQDGNGRTALMEAYSKGQARIAQMLKNAGADPNIKPPTPPPPPPRPSPIKPPELPPPAAATSSIGEETRLGVGKAGFVHIGMPLEEIQKKYPTVTMNQKYINGAKKTIATVYVNGPNNPSLELELSNSNLKLVSTISTSNAQFSTDREISIKSTVGDIRNQYTISDVKVIDNALYLYIRSLKMMFELDITKDEIISDWLTSENASSIPDDVKIKRIVIY